jgi:hypothetical protein
MQKWICLLLLPFLLQCDVDKKKENIESFYLPIDLLADGVVYEYESVGKDSFPPYYWYFRTVEQAEGTTYLVGTQYDHNLVPQQLTREAKVKNGMLMEEIFIYVPDSTGKQVQLPVSIEAGNVFPFEVTDSLGIFLYKVRWFTPSDSVTTTVIRNRNFLGFVDYEWQSITYSGLKFGVREIIISQKEGNVEIELEGEEIYLQGIGLVYAAKKAVASNFEMIYRLKDRYEMKKLEEKLHQDLQGLHDSTN